MVNAYSVCIQALDKLLKNPGILSLPLDWRQLLQGPVNLGGRLSVLLLNHQTQVHCGTVRPVLNGVKVNRCNSLIDFSPCYRAESSQLRIYPFAQCINLNSGDLFQFIVQFSHYILSDSVSYSFETSVNPSPHELTDHDLHSLCY